MSPVYAAVLLDVEGGIALLIVLAAFMKQYLISVVLYVGQNFG
jgi:hypothetical protein